MNPEKLQAIADPNFTPNNDVSDKFTPEASVWRYMICHLLQIVTSLQIIDDLPIENVQ